MKNLKILIITTIIALSPLLVKAAVSHFSSQQLAPSPANGNCLTTNGANPGVNSWAACGGGGSGNSAWTLGLGQIYNATSTDQVLIDETSTTTTASLEVKGVGTNPVLAVTTSTGAEILRVTGSGSLTINSTTPNATLVVQGTTTQPSLDILRIASSSNATFLNITNVGNVGIGSLAPKSKLYISGGGSDNCVSGCNTDLQLTSASTIGTGINLINTDTGGHNIVMLSTGSSAGPGAGSWSLYDNTQAAYVFNFTYGNFETVKVTGGSVAGTGMAFIPNGAGGKQYDFFATANGAGVGGGNLAIYDTGNGAYRFVMDANGNTQIGAGSAAPIAKFNIQGTKNYEIFDAASTSGSSVLRISASEHVGVGSSTPAALLSVKGINEGGNTTTPLFIVASSTNNAILTVLANGQVGIGLNNPSAGLMVQGTGTVLPFQVSTSTGVSMFQININQTAAFNTTTQANVVTIQGSSTIPSLPQFNVASSNGLTLFQVSSTGVGSSSTPPTISSCGTGTPTYQQGSDNFGGAVTVGGGVQTSCTLTWGIPFIKTPVCVASDDSNILAIKPAATINTLILTSATTMAGDTISYICKSNPN